MVGASMEAPLGSGLPIAISGRGGGDHVNRATITEARFDC